MSSAFGTTQDASSNARMHHLRIHSAQNDSLVDLSNVNRIFARPTSQDRQPLSSNTIEHKPLDRALEPKRKKRSFDFLISSRHVKSENSSFYFDGPSDLGIESSRPSTPLRLESISGTREFSTGEPHSNPRGSWIETPLNSTASKSLDVNEDVNDFCHDSGSFESEATADPQTPQTPNCASVPPSFEVRDNFSREGRGVQKLNFRLRPSQRPKTHQTSSIKHWTVDRFASPRRPQMASRDSFKMSRSVSQLTPGQKMHRRRTGQSDPFETPRIRFTRLDHSNLPSTERGPIVYSSFRTARVLGLRQDTESISNRQFSSGNVWSVGGTVSAPNTYSARREGTRSNTLPRSYGRVHVSKFFQNSTPGDDKDPHEKRLALALDIDQAEKVLSWANLALVPPPAPVKMKISSTYRFPKHGAVRNRSVSKMVWRDNEWMRENRTLRMLKNLASTSFADQDPLLEAPLLRDDFYCSVLAYSHRANRLAVALGFKVYLWSEDKGTIELPSTLDVTPLRSAYVTSLAFSSESGGRAILAIGRGDGRIMMWSPIDSEPRFLRLRTPTAAAHVSFRPSVVRRTSQRHSALMAENEVFLVGDDLGIVSVYFVEWPDDSKRFLFGWHGSICLHARITIHTQQVCGISWSVSGDFFSTGGNDNLCCLFQTATVLQRADRSIPPASAELRHDLNGNTHLDIMTNATTAITIRSENSKHQWKLNAAVKAMAFCPWQPGLLAAGGGSNDRCIHFYHTFSGACLATIDCAAQVTSLVWSTSRREIAATFGFAQPEHPFRVAVYAWPSCEQIVAIPWGSEMRALHAIAYPGRPDYGERSSGRAAWASRGADEGCIVIAGSDGSIKFHEIWSEERKATAPHQGLLGGSDILEGLHGIEKESRETIR